MINVYRFHKNGGARQNQFSLPDSLYNDDALRANIFRMVAGVDLDLTVAIWTLSGLGKEFKPFIVKIDENSIQLGDFTYYWEKV